MFRTGEAPVSIPDSVSLDMHCFFPRELKTNSIPDDCSFHKLTTIGNNIIFVESPTDVALVAASTPTNY